MDNIKTFTNRTRQYWFIDGLAEINLGLIFIAFGLLLLVIEGVSRKTPAGFGLLVLMPVLFIVGGRVSRKVLRALKERITYPRTGYVSYKPQPRRTWPQVLGVLITAGLIGLMVRFGPGIQNWMPLLNGVLLAVILLFVGQGLWRFYLLSGAVLLTGLLLAAANMGGNLGHAYFYALSGLIILVSGGLTFWVYLRNAPQPEGTNE